MKKDDKASILVSTSLEWSRLLKAAGYPQKGSVWWLDIEEKGICEEIVSPLWWEIKRELFPDCPVPWVLWKENFTKNYCLKLADFFATMYCVLAGVGNIPVAIKK